MNGGAPTVLVTGFEPFGGEPVNPSAQVALALHGRRIAGHEVTGAMLPCAFASALPALDELLQRVRPRLVLALGQAGGRCDISIERVALNLIDARIADNAGAQPVDHPVIEGAPAAHFASLPVKAMVQGLRERGLPASLSLSAGSFVCNAVFFALMHRLAALPGVRGGFVHLPLLPEQAARSANLPSLPLATQVDGVHEAVAVALATVEDLRYSAGTIA